MTSHNVLCEHAVSTQVVSVIRIPCYPPLTFKVPYLPWMLISISNNMYVCFWLISHVLESFMISKIHHTKEMIFWLHIGIYRLCSSGSSDWVRGGPRNMKSMRPPLVAIFFMTYFYRARGGHGPLAPPGSATAMLIKRVRAQSQLFNTVQLHKNVFAYLAMMFRFIS